MRILHLWCDTYRRRGWEGNLIHPLRTTKSADGTFRRISMMMNDGQLPSPAAHTQPTCKPSLSMTGHTMDAHRSPST
jgi:hypothetical protein